MKDMYSPTGWENAVDCGNALDNEYPFTLKKTAPQQAAPKAADSVNQNNLENLLELIDNFAETRHTCGHWTYNLKSNEARQKVIAALKGNDLS